MQALARSALSLALSVAIVWWLAPQSRAAETIRIGILKVTVMAPLWLADEKGWFAAENLQPRFIDFDAPPPVVSALLSGDIDVGVTGLSAAFFNAAGQGALRIIAGDVSEHPGFQVVGFAASKAAHNAGLRAIKDLPGHSLAIPSVGSPHHYALGLFAEKYGFAISAVRLVQAGTFGNVAAAVSGGSVDAGASSATSLKPGIQHGDTFLLAWFGDELPMQTGATMTTAATADNKRDMLQRFLRVYKRGVVEFRAAFNGPGDTRADGPTAPAMYELLAKHLNAPVETIKLGMGYVAPDLTLDVQDVMRQIDWYKRQGLVKSEVDGAKIIDMRYVVPLPEK
jgi:NitT/TauT family transport system substrate-binding protein